MFVSAILINLCLSSVLPDIQVIFGHLLESKLQYYTPDFFWKNFKLEGRHINVLEHQVRLFINFHVRHNNANNIHVHVDTCICICSIIHVADTSKFNNNNNNYYTVLYILSL